MEIKYRINDMAILKILCEYSSKQSDVNYIRPTETELLINFRPSDNDIQIHKGILILDGWKDFLPSNIMKSIEQHCTKITLRNEILSGDWELEDTYSSEAEAEEVAFVCQEQGRAKVVETKYGYSVYTSDYLA